MYSLFPKTQVESIRVVSDKFENLSSLKRHQLVYKAIWEELQVGSRLPSFFSFGTKRFLLQASILSRGLVFKLHLRRTLLHLTHRDEACLGIRSTIIQHAAERDRRARCAIQRS